MIMSVYISIVYSQHRSLQRFQKLLHKRYFFICRQQEPMSLIALNITGFQYKLAVRPVIIKINHYKGDSI